MSVSNKNILEELDRYKNSSTDSFYAIQIDAPWGSGKTFFIRKYLEDSYPYNADEERKYLHISLFGIQSLTDIEKQIVGQLFTAGERIAGSMISSLLSVGAAWIKADKVTAEVAERSRLQALAKALEAVKKGMIVFDDVERCSIPLKDALGYINQFVERDKYKVVIITNENALIRNGASDEEKKNYLALTAFKEKLIGKTLRLKSDPEKAFDLFISTFKHDLSKQVASSEKSAVVSVFEASQRDNLRSLRIGLEAYERLVAGFKPGTSVKEEGLKDILKGCVYVALETGAAVNQSIVGSPMFGRSTRLMRGLGSSKEAPPSDDEKAADLIVNRYGEVLNFRSPTIPLDILVDFISNGILRSDDIEQSLKISPLMNDPSAVPVWRKLIEIWDYNISGLESDTAEAVNKFAEFGFSDPGELMHLAGIMIWRESYGDLTLSGGALPEAFMENYLAGLSASGKALEIKYDVFAMDRLSAYGYIVLCADEHRDRLESIYGMIKMNLDKAASALYPEIYQKILEAMRRPDRNLDSILPDQEQFYLQEPIFSVVDPSDFADLILRDGNFDHAALKWLKDRYWRHVHPEVKAAEQEWINDLYFKLESRVRSLPKPLDGWWMNLLNMNLKGFIDEAVVTPRTDTHTEVAAPT